MKAELVLMPVLAPLIAAALALLLRRSWRGQMLVGHLALVVALLSSAFLTYDLMAGRPLHVYQLGHWAAPMGITFVADKLSSTFVLMSSFVMLFGLLYARGARDRSVRNPGFVPLFLTLGAALSGGILTGDVFNFFVFAELLVISAAVLTAISDDEGGAEAAWKYFYISTFAGILLIGASGCFYAGYGTLNIADLTVLIAERPSEPLLRPAAALLVAALLIKAAVVPFHFWQPDFHTVSPTPVSAMLSGIVVKLGVYGLIRCLTLLLFPLRDVLLPLLMVLGIAGVVLGSFAAMGTHNAKRVLAYSTLAQVGFILIALGTGTELGLVAAVVFSVNHALIKSAMLMLAGAMASRAPIKSASFDAVTGAGRASPLAGWLFLIGAMALVGMPPTNGFISKLLVLDALSQTPGQIRPWLMVLFVCLASLLTLLYTFRAYSLIWWHPLPPGKATKKYGDNLLAPLALISTCILLGLAPSGLSKLSRATAHSLQERSAYINAVLPRTTPAVPVALTEEPPR